MGVGVCILDRCCNQIMYIVEIGRKKSKLDSNGWKEGGREGMSRKGDERKWRGGGDSFHSRAIIYDEMTQLTN